MPPYFLVETITKLPSRVSVNFNVHSWSHPYQMHLPHNNYSSKSSCWKSNAQPPAIHIHTHMNIWWIITHTSYLLIFIIHYALSTSQTPKEPAWQTSVYHLTLFPLLFQYNQKLISFHFRLLIKNCCLMF